MQIVVLVRKRHRDQDNGAEFTYRRLAEDITAKVAVEVAGLAENRNEDAE
jgi:hypothetical protein